MQRVGQIESSFYSSIERAKRNSSIVTIEKNPHKITTKDADLTINLYPDLIEPNYRPFFFKKLYAIGLTQFIQYADHARKYGNNPQKLFVQILKGVK